MPEPLSALAYFEKLKHLYAGYANSDNAFHMKRYVKNRFNFYGIKTPDRRHLSMTLIKSEGIPPQPILQALCLLCFQGNQRELQYFVNDIGRKAIPYLDPSFLQVLEDLIGQKSWWDTIDFLSPKLAGPLLLRYPELIPDYPGRWIASDNIWYQRSAILFQLHYKEKTDRTLLFDFILQRKDSREFFVQKAAGWALRQYSRTAPEAVVAFIEQEELPALTKREGLKWLKNR